MDVRRCPMHNDRGPRVRGYKIMTTPNEALRTILPIAGWGDMQAAEELRSKGFPTTAIPYRDKLAKLKSLPLLATKPTSEFWK